MAAGQRLRDGSEASLKLALKRRRKGGKQEIKGEAALNKWRRDGDEEMGRR